MIANTWYCIAQTSTFDTSCSINVAFDGYDIQFSASVRFGVSSINITRCNLPYDIVFSLRLRESGTQWFIDLFSSREITPNITIADSSYWQEVNATAGIGNVTLVLSDITSKFNTAQGGGTGGLDIEQLRGFLLDNGYTALLDYWKEDKETGAIYSKYNVYTTGTISMEGEDSEDPGEIISNTITIRLGEVEYVSEDGVINLPPYPEAGIDEEAITALITPISKEVESIKENYATKDEVKGIDERFTDGKANEAKKVENKLSFGTKEYDGSKAENIEASDLDAVTTKDNQTITGEKTFTAPINADGGIDIEDGKSLKIGGITLSYDEQSDSLKIDGNVWSEGTMSMNGYDEEGESGETTATNLDGLTDVRITSPSAGDVLTYDDVNNEWVNKPADKGLNTDELQEFLDNNDYAKKDDIPSTEGLATEDWVENKGYLTAVPEKYVTDTELEDKGYATKTEVDSKLQAGLSGAFTSLQSNTRTPVSMTIGGVTKVIDQEALRKSLALGTAAYESKDTFATQEALNETDAEVDEHTKIVNILQQTLAQATATIAELQRRLAIVEDWGFQFDMTEGGSRILVTPHNFVSEGAISFSGESTNEEFEQRIVLITQAEYDALAAKGQINETKIYYVY